MNAADNSRFISVAGEEVEARVAKLLWLAGSFTTSADISDETIAYGLSQRGVEATPEAIGRVRTLLDER